MPTRRVNIVAEGKVQGVFFRACTADEAIRLGLTGWVRNRPDGSVEAAIEGDATSVAEMLRWLQRGSPQSTVTRVRVTEEEPGHQWDTFSIRY